MRIQRPLFEVKQKLGGVSGTVSWRLLIAAAVCCGARVAIAGPYSPAPPAAGSDAVSGTNNPAIVEWASGYQNYVIGSQPETAYNNPNEALGPFKDISTDVTNLGEGGQITYTFAEPIVAGTSGFDFAVFGNGFESTYEKLAYVEVSANGVNWYTMTNYDLNPEPPASPSFTYGLTDPTDIYGLAGKYQLGYGVGFNLSEVGLTSASYVRIVDAIGNGTSLDSAGNPIWDPYPNDQGFNVAAIGVMSAAPEPSSIVLLLVGLALLAIGRLRRAAARIRCAV